jgi:glucosylceramidase
VAAVVAATPARLRATGATVSVWLTSSDQSRLLALQGATSFAPDAGTDPTTIDVDEWTTYQQIDGFGASFTDSSAWLVYNKLSTTARTDVMNKLFATNPGTGLS